MPRYDPVPEAEVRPAPEAEVQLAEVEVITNPMQPESQSSGDATCSEEEVDLEAAAQGPVFRELRVLDNQGTTYRLKNVPQGTSMALFKKIVEKKTGVPSGRQRLIYGG